MNHKDRQLSVYKVRINRAITDLKTLRETLLKKSLKEEADKCLEMMEQLSGKYYPYCYEEEAVS